MKLLTKEILKKLPTIEETAQWGLEETKVICKFFNPLGNQRWYVTAYDPDTGKAWGFVNLGDIHCAEMGPFMMQELVDIRLPFGLGIERDAHFTPRSLKEVMDDVYAGKHV
jgi:hypothetical protein